MKTQACEPCAKRKVRCDKEEPSCSNCKRRKRDNCIYPEVSPYDRIRKLEQTVRGLGGDPLLNQTRTPESPKETAPCAEAGKATDSPVLLQEGEQSIYVESEGWQTWIDATRLHKGTKTNDDASAPRVSAHCSGKQLPHAFQCNPWGSNFQEMSSEVCPIPQADALKLWNLFIERVEPIIKISFEWTLRDLKAALQTSGGWARLNSGDRVLILSSCLFGAVSLTGEECEEGFNRPKHTLVTECRLQCEAAFSNMNLLAIDDLSILKAFCLYAKANIDRVTSRSLWSLMGLVGRSAEQLALHRDGTALGLSPVDTEDRRRLWWQLQHLDLILAIKCGMTPLSFVTDWDTKLPLNVDDCDLEATKTTIIEQRGLTSFSYTLFTYWIIEKQRNFRSKRLNQQVTIDKSLLGALTDTMIDDLEAGINKAFLQFCDPIVPVDTLLQISARAVIGVLRLRRLHELRIQSQRVDEKCHGLHFSTCMQLLKYIVITHTNPLLQPFLWYAETAFVWHAFIGVLVDLPELRDAAKARAAWSLLTEVYTVVKHLSDLSDDRRNAYAAKSVVATWYKFRDKPELESMVKPDFVSELERRISELEVSQALQRDTTKEDENPVDPKQFWQDGDDLQPFDFNFEDVDWSFWEHIS